MNLCTSRDTAILPLFVTRFEETPAGGPDTFLTDWNNWTSISLFPPPVNSVLFRVCQKLTTFQGSHTTPNWPTQSRCNKLFHTSPHPSPLGTHCMLSPHLGLPLRSFSLCGLVDKVLIRLNHAELVTEIELKGTISHTQKHSRNSSRETAI